MTLLVEQTAMMMTVQDSGRLGYRRYGMPESGPMDWWAHRCANRLVGNPSTAACLEIGFSSAVLVAEGNAIMSVCGAGFMVSVNNRTIPLWMSFWVNPGDRILLEKIAGGEWVYLAVQGGIQSPQWMGSGSMYLRAGLGSRVLAGDRIKLDLMDDPRRTDAGKYIPNGRQPRYSDAPIIRAVPGPHQDWFTETSLRDFFEQPYALTPNIDRMGYRLFGSKMNYMKTLNLISQGMAMGEVQVPPDGEHIVMMPDHPTTGGYPCIATVIKADLPLLAQSQPGISNIHFKQIEVSEAQEALRTIIQRSDSKIEQEDDLWLQY